MAEPTYEQLESSIHQWTQGRSEILAALVVGSRGRLNPPPDEWSDLDLVFFCQDVEILLDEQWLHEFGEVWMAHLYEDQPNPEWQVVYTGGLKVDFLLGLVKVSGQGTPTLAEMLSSFPHQGVLRRGIRLLGEQETLPYSTQALIPLPDQETFNTQIHEMLFSALRTAKLIRRGELWQAQRQLNCDFREYLLWLIEWEARQRLGMKVDTWYAGRHLRDWGNPRILERIPSTYANYDEKELWPALIASVDLFRDIAMSLAKEMDLVYPGQEERRITRFIRQLSQE
jgi:aminoglycoside 6-adenylyltransferase